MFVLWSAFFVFAAISWSPSGVFNAISPLALALFVATMLGDRLGGPAREFLLTRPLGRLRYHLAPIGFGLLVTLAPPVAELAVANRRGEAALDVDIRGMLCRPATLGNRPRSDDLEAWHQYYARSLRREVALASLPGDALTPNPDRGDSMRYLPSANLRAAVRDAWQARTLRIALLCLTLFLVLYGLAAAAPAERDGSAGRAWAAARWTWQNVRGIAVAPLLLAAAHPEWLLVPTWTLVLAAPLAGALLCRAVMRAEVS